MLGPKARLSFSIVALVATVVIVLSVVYLYGITETKFRDVLEIARISGEQVKTHVLETIRIHSQIQAPRSLEEGKRVWRKWIHEDPQLTSFLIGTIASSRSVVEILIVDEQGIIVASSNPARVDTEAPLGRDLPTWSRQSTGRKLWQVLWNPSDYDLGVPLGVAGGGEALFTIRVVVSSVLLRDAVVPVVQGLALVSLLCVVASAILAWVLANLAARPLAQLSRMIDLVAQGEGAASLTPASADPELAALRSKLTLLGERIRGAAEDFSGLRGNIERLLEKLEDAVLLFGADGRLVMAGKAAERYVALGRWELMGRTLEEVLPSSTPLGGLVRGSVQLSQQLRNHPLTFKRPDGREARALVSVEMIEGFPARQKMGVVVTLRDAETRRQLESQLDDSFRNEALGKILRGVAHEIKNPLNAIFTHLQLLRLEMEEKAPELRSEVEVISREIKTLDKMVVALLDFTRPLELSRAEVGLVSLAGELALLVRPEAAHKGIKVEVSGPEGAVVWADRALLRQAIMNVVLNAIEAMDHQGRIVIDVVADGDEWSLSVSDEGPGIPEEIQDKIYNLYFTTKGRGSGIGLAMTYRIVQLHSASIDFTTERGKGTTFRFRLPAYSRDMRIEKSGVRSEESEV